LTEEGIFYIFFINAKLLINEICPGGMMDLQKRIYELHAEVCKTLAHPKRLEILHYLRDSEMMVSEIAERVGAPKANISQHLAMMRQSGIVTTRRDGVNVYYRISNPKVIQACNLMREVLMEQLAETEKLARQIIKVAE